MKRILILPKSIVLFLFIYAVAAPHLAAQLEHQAVDFQLQGNAYRVTVQYSDIHDGTDILLNGDGVVDKNLSLPFPGENLLPSVTVHPRTNRFLVAWTHYREGDMQMCLYDSLWDSTQFLTLENFNSARPVKVAFQDDSPMLLFFSGNNSGNVDVFYYNLTNGHVRNVTQSEGFEYNIQIFDEENRVFIEATTAFHQSRYRIKKRTLHIKQTKNILLDREAERTRSVFSENPDALNTIVSFGDSITAGTMYMNDLDGYSHPELAYPAQLQEILAADYGTTFSENLGYPGDRTSMAWERMVESFTGIQGKYCLVILGTNDVINLMDSTLSMHYLQLIVEKARNDYNMHVIISTIPPLWRKAKTLQHRIKETEKLNDEIIKYAVRDNIPYIDSYTSFIEHPEGWWTLLEDQKGNHPGPKGHRVIAELFKEKILEVPPVRPQDIEVTDGSQSFQTIEWTLSNEFDFSHYIIEFGFSPYELNRSAVVESSFFTFLRPSPGTPFQSKIYFRIRSVDKDGNEGLFTAPREVEFTAIDN
jgi:lysophospholipase L1-like esterase